MEIKTLSCIRLYVLHGLVTFEASSNKQFLFEILGSIIIKILCQQRQYNQNSLYSGEIGPLILAKFWYFDGILTECYLSRALYRNLSCNSLGTTGLSQKTTNIKSSYSKLLSALYLDAIWQLDKE